MSTKPVPDLSSWYLAEEDEEGEGRVQSAVIQQLLHRLRLLAVERGWQDYVLDSDQYIMWMKEDERVRCAPDIYLIWNPPENPWVESWQTWLPGHSAPAFERTALTRTRAVSWRKPERRPPAQSGRTPRHE